MAVSIISSCSEMPPEVNQPKAIALLNGDDYAQVEKPAGWAGGRSVDRTRASIYHFLLLLLQNLTASARKSDGD